VRSLWSLVAVSDRIDEAASAHHHIDVSATAGEVFDHYQPVRQDRCFAGAILLDRLDTRLSTEATMGPPARRGLRARRWTARGVAVLVAAAVVGSGLQVLAERRDADNHPPPGQLVTLPDGRDLHLDVQGGEHNGPVVVLETGMGGFSAAWGWVQPYVAEYATVVSYDRPGLGWSQSSPNGPEAEHVIADLRAGLAELDLDGRGYVLVGHSLGGHYVRAFAQTYPGEVVGMVLIDPSHERQAEAIPGYESDMASGAMMMRVASITSRLGIHRLYDPFASMVSDLPEPQLSQALAAQVAPGYFRSYRAEFGALDDIGATLAAGETDLGDLPLAVLIAASSPTEAGQASVDAAVELREDLERLSTRARTVMLPDADHLTIVTHADHARVVADEIRATLAAVDG
jgi:pimeloyl-ACP methyl ester carboxylesterase